jgi:PAS domain-containing protein
VTHVLHLVEDAAQAAAVDAAFREAAPHVDLTVCGTPLQLRERFAGCRPCLGVVMDDRVAGGALAPLVRHLRAEDAAVPLILVSDLEGDAAQARRALAGVDHVVPREAVAVIPTLLAELRAAAESPAPRLRALVAGAGTVLPSVLAGCRRADLTMVALDGSAADPAWTSADVLVLVSSSTGEQAAVALLHFRRIHPTLPVVVVAEERLRDGFLRLDAFDSVPPSAGVDRFEEAIERAARVRRVLVEAGQVRAREARLRAMVERLPSGVVVASADGTVMAANLAALALMGLGAATDAVGRPFASLVRFDDPETGALPAPAPGTAPATLRVAARNDASRRMEARITSHLRDEATPVLLVSLTEASGAAAGGQATDDTAPRQDTTPDDDGAALEGRLGALARELATAQEARSQLAAELDEARAQFADVSARRTMLEQWNADLDALRAADQATIAALRAELDAARRAAEQQFRGDTAASEAHVLVPGTGDADSAAWALEAAGVGTLLTSPAGEMLGCNGTGARLCGYPAAAAVPPGGRVPEVLRTHGLPGPDEDRRSFEVCFEGADGLLQWVLGSAVREESDAGDPPVVRWHLVDRSETHRSASRGRFLRRMDEVAHLLTTAADACATSAPEAGGTTVAEPTGAGDVLRQLARFAHSRGRRPAVVEVGGVVTSMAPVLSRLAGEDASLELAPGAGDARVHADPAEVEDLLVQMVMAGRDVLPAGGAIVLATRTAASETMEGATRMHRPEAVIALAARGLGCTPMTVPAPVTEAVARLGGRLAATHEPGRATHLLVKLVPVLRLAGEGAPAGASRQPDEQAVR